MKACAGFCLEMNIVWMFLIITRLIKLAFITQFKEYNYDFLQNSLIIS